MDDQRRPMQIAFGMIMLGAGAIFTNYATSDKPGWVSAIGPLIWLVVAATILLAIAAQPGFLRRRTRLALPVDRPVSIPTPTQRAKYVLPGEVIDRLPVRTSIRIDRVEYGVGARKIRIDVTESETLSLPHAFTAIGTKMRHSTIALILISDRAYLAGVSAYWTTKFEIDAFAGRGGIEPYLDVARLDASGEIWVITDTGAPGRIVAVEFRSGVPTARSNYADFVRRGIRYPDDVWRSTVTGQPIMQEKRQRVAFVSHQPHGTSSDVFACNVDGSDMVNLTEEKKDSYNGFHQGTVEVAKWVDENNLKIASMHSLGNFRRRIVRDPPHDRAGADQR
ncbi:hypothetical protein AB0H71_25545 [Nocardia sp. NPDC050697]|uniref:hypothetical protein n=1 Tax=Nocardia sp. NPDC050697 TaxID=3155158 RepID=UPI0033FAE9E2